MQLHANLHTSACVQTHSKRSIRSVVSTSSVQPIKRSVGGPGWLRNAPCERGLVACYASEDELHETKLGPNVASGIKEVKEKLTWSSATVVRNEAVNLNGTHRLLHLSVSDEVDMLYGRKIQAVPDTARWIDSFTVPGQFVGIRFQGDTDETAAGLKASNRLYSIACSPYESRRDSAYIGASLIEVVVDKGSEGDEQKFGDLAPGAVVEVSQVVGRGFSSLFNSYASLSSALEEQRNLLVLAVGVRGIAAARSALNWAPVQAHATANKVTCFYVTRSPATAAFLPEWDVWREAGISFNPLYTESLSKGSSGIPLASIDSSSVNGSSSKAVKAGAGDNGSSSSDVGMDVSNEDIRDLLDQGLFLHEHGLEGAIGCRPSECTVLLSGLSGDVASAVAKELTFKGVSWERLLFVDYF